MRKGLFICILGIFPITSIAQSDDFLEKYKSFKNEKLSEYDNFRVKANKDYSDFMRQSWQWFNDNPEIPVPEKDIKPIKITNPKQDEISLKDKEPLIYNKLIKTTPLKKELVAPVSPIEEYKGNTHLFEFEAYGTKMQVRVANDTKLTMNGVSENDVADAWNVLASPSYNNMINDCLDLRKKYNLCDWAYLNTLYELSQAYMGKNTSEATLLQAFLFTQSGYKVRLGRSKSNHLYMLVGSKHTIYKQNYFKLGNENFYPLNYKENGLFIFNVPFPKENNMSLAIYGEPQFDKNIIENELAIKTDSLEKISIRFNSNLMNFYMSYPQSHINNDEMTKWTFYAKTPLSSEIKNQLYPILQKKINGKNEIEAANTLLCFVQTSFEYQLDDVIWGEDRPFFPEETLFYPFSDCEDRAMLYSTLIRDLLHLDTVLLYYPGHLAMAINFNNDVEGKTINIDGKKYTYCEATCNNFAPVGWFPPNLKNFKPNIITY